MLDHTPQQRELLSLRQGLWKLAQERCLRVRLYSNSMCVRHCTGLRRCRADNRSWGERRS